MFDIKISGTGIYLPPRVETSEELVTRINKPVDWIHQKAGVFERRVSDIDVDKMGAIAGKEALNNGPPPDLIINASGFMLIRVFMVSLNVSPLDKELLSKFILMELCPSFFAANSKLTVVLVEGSKNKLKIFLGIFAIWFFLEFLNLIA